MLTWQSLPLPIPPSILFPSFYQQNLQQKPRDISYILRDYMFFVSCLLMSFDLKSHSFCNKRELGNVGGSLSPLDGFLKRYFQSFCVLCREKVGRKESHYILLLFAFSSHDLPNFNFVEYNYLMPKCHFLYFFLCIQFLIQCCSVYLQSISNCYHKVLKAVDS